MPANTQTFDREFFFDSVRTSLFGGKLTQSQVDGMDYILSAWEANPPSDDTRWLAYCLSTTFHESAQTMQPIEEYGKGAGYEYGKPDPETGQTYYGRGFVQLTWKDNYERAGTELESDLVWNPELALDPTFAAIIMFRGMEEGWFRSPHTLGKYFNDSTDDPFGAREIINGDKNYIPDWLGGVKIGDLIAGYHRDFLAALKPVEGRESREPRDEEGWQPIESMPFGKEVLLLWLGGEPTPHYEVTMGRISPNDEWKRDEYWSPCGEYRSMEKIVGWAPLLEPPALENKE